MKNQLPTLQKPFYAQKNQNLTMLNAIGPGLMMSAKTLSNSTMLHSTNSNYIHFMKIWSTE